ANRRRNLWRKNGGRLLILSRIPRNTAVSAKFFGLPQNTSAPASETEFFTVVFYGLTTFFLPNTANLRYAVRIRFSQTPSVSKGAQVCGNPRKTSTLNYESPALTAELQAHCAFKSTQSNR